MSKLSALKSALAGSAGMIATIAAAHAAPFDIPGGDLRAALQEYSSKTGIELLYLDSQLAGVHTRGAHGDLSADVALTHILSGTGFVEHRHAGGAVAVVPAPKQSARAQMQANVLRVADAAPVHAAASVETVVVTSSKIKGDIQTVPIAITALSQEQLTSRQIAGGPDLVKEVPNLTFSKTNFTGYNIEIRGIGTQAISVATDPAVAVALNDIPFIRNHFFEQEFYDVGQVEVLRGPQGTLYGRNATAGVVNVISAKPTDQFEAMLSADWGNFHNRRYEGMINIPVVDDRVDLRIAGEWTKRDGYSYNTLTNSPIDGRDLWSSRVTLGVKPVPQMQVYLVWEHFQENDDRLRSSKQLCHTDNSPDFVDGVPVPPIGANSYAGGAFDPAGYLSQGCKMDGLYDKGHPNSPVPDYGSFGVPDGFSLQYIKAAKLYDWINPTLDPYAEVSQSTNLRDIESTVNPRYAAKNDTFELNADYNITPSLTFTSQTGYNHDFLYSIEDYNRFSSSPGLFVYRNNNLYNSSIVDASGIFCDPQVGCADRLVAIDRSDEHAWQLSQEFRLASDFKGPLNFSVGGNYLHYETEENYYVFINALTLYALESFGIPNSNVYDPRTSDNHECLYHFYYGFNLLTIKQEAESSPSQNQCNYIDPNPIPSVNNNGHNYFLSQNPYVLNSYAGFGEVYYQASPEVKLIGGLRWTNDQKHFTNIPSEVLSNGWGYPSSGVVNNEWREWTGRFTANWTPKLDFTDQTLIYGSYARGYKAGGANPPGAVLVHTDAKVSSLPIHPLTFKPEFVNAYELGTKNTLADGALTLNGDVFYYDYKGYQISRIVDRTAINDNFDAKVQGAELEAMWEPLPGLRFNFAGGYEHTRVNNGQSSIDLIDRTAGNPDWIVVKPFPTAASNCILPTYVMAALLENPAGTSIAVANACTLAYQGASAGLADGNNGTLERLDPVTSLPYVENPTVAAQYDFGGNHPSYLPPGYPGFDGLSVDPNAPADVNNGLGLPPNNGEGFAKPLGGHELPNAPHFTTSLSADYTIPVSEDWAATLHSDFYWQSQSWARVFNDRPYDKIRGYSNVNLALILTSANGWQVMGYLKNVFDTTAITGDFLNSDDTGLTTNVFLTDPRLFGVRVTKNW